MGALYCPRGAMSTGAKVTGAISAPALAPARGTSDTAMATPLSGNDDQLCTVATTSTPSRPPPTMRVSAWAAVRPRTRRGTHGQ